MQVRPVPKGRDAPGRGAQRRPEEGQVQEDDPEAEEGGQKAEGMPQRSNLTLDLGH